MTRWLWRWKEKPQQTPTPEKTTEFQKRRLVCYLKGGAGGWIYEALWHDLCATNTLRSSENLEFLVAKDFEELRSLLATPNTLALVFPGHLNRLIAKGIPPSQIILYFAHVRAGIALPCLNQLHAILCLNSFEKALIEQEGVDFSRLHQFPIGYSSSLFSCRESQANKKSDFTWDVLFSGRYVEKNRVGYHRRKRYSFQVKLANAIASTGLNVALLGPGWGDCEYELDKNVTWLKCDHSSTPKVYNDARIVCSVSGQEGGPVSFLEGLACGCLMISTPSGFASEFQSGSDGVWLMPLRASVDDWVAQIQRCLEQNANKEIVSSDERRAFLHRAEFEQLAQQLASIASSPIAPH